MTKYRIEFYGSMTLAVACWLLATGFAVEKVVQDGIQSWTLLAAMPVLTLAVGVLLHRGFEDIRNFRLLRGPTGIVLALLGLCVTLPASIGSSGQARDTAIAVAQASNRSLDVLREDLATVTRTLNWAQEDMVDECGSGEGARCRGKRSTVQALVDRKDRLTLELQEAPAERPATSGESRIAWALSAAGLSVTEDTVRMGWPMLPPVAFELLCAFFMCLGLGRGGEFVNTGKSVVPLSFSDVSQTSFPIDLEQLPGFRDQLTAELPDAPKPRKRTKRQARKEKTVAWVRDYTLQNGAPPKFRLVKGRFHLPAATASRWRSEAIKQASN